MAGFVATTAAWDALLQEDYVMGEITEAINTATPFRDKLQRKAMTSGRESVRAIKVGASQGGGARAEGANMPPYGAGEYQNATLKAKYNYAPFKITGQSEAFGTKRAFVEFGMQILKDTKEALRLFTGRQCWGDGQGTLAMINGALLAGVTTATVDSPYGVLWGSLAGNTTFLLKRKMVVQFGAEDNNGQGYTIATVGTTTFTFTPALQNNVADNVLISTFASANLEIEGALLFCATAALQTTLGFANTIYHNIDRTLFPEWEGNVINAGAALTLALVRSMRDTIYKRTDDEETNLMIGSTEVARDYEALLVPGQRFVPATKLQGGHSILEHDGLRFSKDSKAPVKALWFFNTQYIGWRQTADPHWLQDGTGILRVVPGQDAKEGLLVWYSNIECWQPRRNGAVINITVV